MFLADRAVPEPAVVKTASLRHESARAPATIDDHAVTLQSVRMAKLGRCEFRNEFMARLDFQALSVYDAVSVMGDVIAMMSPTSALGFLLLNHHCRCMGPAR